MLASALKRVLKEKFPDIEAIFCSKKTLDVTDVSGMEVFFQKNKPDIIIHLAAFTDVNEAEKAEDFRSSPNYLVNAIGTEYLAKLSTKYGFGIVFVSTDFVFDGTKKTPYESTDMPNPINHYGRAKLLGEKSIERFASKWVIIRTGWLYDEDLNGNHFIGKILGLTDKISEISVIADEVGRPTFTWNLAEALVYIMKDLTKFEYKILHLTDTGAPVSRADLARKIIQIFEKNTKILEKYEPNSIQKVQRPKNSVLADSGFDDMKDWEQTMEQIFKNRNFIW